MYCRDCKFAIKGYTKKGLIWVCTFNPPTPLINFRNEKFVVTANKTQHDYRCGQFQPKKTKEPVFGPNRVSNGLNGK